MASTGAVSHGAASVDAAMAVRAAIMQKKAMEQAGEQAIALIEAAQIDPEVGQNIDVSV